MKTWTFLFTDIEGSTVLFERAAAVYSSARDQHEAVLRAAIAAHGGAVFRGTGDGVLAAFAQPDAALAGAVACQDKLAAVSWPAELGALRVRIGLHRGEAEQGEGDFHGLVMHHATRVLDAGHGGQIVCSETIASVAGAEWRDRLGDLGLYRLRGVSAPVRLFEVAHAAAPAAGFPPLRTPAAFTHRLPAPPTRFFGREAELHDLAPLLAPEPPARTPRSYGRLITLLGPGGTGKTRLSLAIADRLLPAYSHAVWFAPLAEIRDATVLPEALREALGLEPEAGALPLDQVLEHLRGQPSLLVLDNFEQLVPAGVDCVRRLLEGAPQLVCLVSSRIRLDLRAEQEFALTPLRLPPVAGTPEELLRYPSVQLFCDRARAARRDFQLDEANAADIAEVCRALEGVPLAIELAAARAAVVTPRQTLQRLSQRLDFLTGGRRDAPDRHRSLRAAIAWSYELLADPARQFFTRLAVFRGGWTLEAAEAIAAQPAAPVLDLLEELRACSLITAQDDAGQMRYGMLELLRDYAAEQLAADAGRDALEERFHRFFFELIANREPLDQAQHFERLASEAENLRTLLGQSGPIAERLRAAVSLYPFWMTRGLLREGGAWLHRLLAEAADTPDAPRAAAENAAGILAWKAGDYPAATRLLSSALRHWETRAHQRNIAGVLNNLALVAKDQGDLPQAQRHLERALAIYREAGPSAELAAVLNNLGECALRLRELELAQARLEESVAVERTCGTTAELANSLHNLGELHLVRGDSRRARRYFGESIALRQRLGSRDVSVQAFTALAALARQELRLETAAMLYAAAACALEAGEEAPNAEICAEIECETKALRERLPRAVFEQAREAGLTARLGEYISAEGEWLNPLDRSAAPMADQRP